MDLGYELGSDGMLSIKGHSDFSVTDKYYSAPSYSSEGYLTSFTIWPTDSRGEGTYIIHEKGLKVGPEGLIINNLSSASKIVFLINADNWINLNGNIRITGHKTDLILVTPYRIYCNGCASGGEINSLTFCLVPSVKNLTDELLKSDPSNYCFDYYPAKYIDYKINWHFLYIGKQGANLNNDVMFYGEALAAYGELSVKGKLLLKIDFFDGELCNHQKVVDFREKINVGNLRIEIEKSGCQAKISNDALLNNGTFSFISPLSNDLIIDGKILDSAYIYIDTKGDTEFKGEVSINYDVGINNSNNLLFKSNVSIKGNAKVNAHTIYAAQNFNVTNGLELHITDQASFNSLEIKQNGLTGDVNKFKVTGFGDIHGNVTLATTSYDVLMSESSHESVVCTSLDKFCIHGDLTLKPYPGKFLHINSMVVPKGGPGPNVKFGKVEGQVNLINLNYDRNGTPLETTEKLYLDLREKAIDFMPFYSGFKGALVHFKSASRLFYSEGSFVHKGVLIDHAVYFHGEVIMVNEAGAIIASGAITSVKSKVDINASGYVIVNNKVVAATNATLIGHGVLIEAGAQVKAAYGVSYIEGGYIRSFGWMLAREGIKLINNYGPNGDIYFGKGSYLDSDSGLEISGPAQQKIRNFHIEDAYRFTVYDKFTLRAKEFKVIRNLKVVSYHQEICEQLNITTYLPASEVQRYDRYQGSPRIYDFHVNVNNKIDYVDFKAVLYTCNVPFEYRDDVKIKCEGAECYNAAPDTKYDASTWHNIEVFGKKCFFEIVDHTNVIFNPTNVNDITKGSDPEGNYHQGSYCITRYRESYQARDDDAKNGDPEFVIGGDFIFDGDKIILNNQQIQVRNLKFLGYTYLYNEARQLENYIKIFGSFYKWESDGYDWSPKSVRWETSEEYIFRVGGHVIKRNEEGFYEQVISARIKERLTSMGYKDISPNYHKNRFGSFKYQESYDSATISGIYVHGVLDGKFSDIHNVIKRGMLYEGITIDAKGALSPYMAGAVAMPSPNLHNVASVNSKRPVFNEDQYYNPFTHITPQYLNRVYNVNIDYLTRKDKAPECLDNYCYAFTEKMEPLRACDKGIEDLLKQAGINPANSPLIVCPPSCQQDLVSEQLGRLTGVFLPMKVAYEQQTDYLKALDAAKANGDEVAYQKLKINWACEQFYVGMKNYLEQQPKLGLVIGRMLNDYQSENLEKWIVAPVLTQILDYQNPVLVPIVYMPKGAIRLSPAFYGAFIEAGILNIEFDYLKNSGLFAASKGGSIQGNTIENFGSFIAREGELNIGIKHKLLFASLAETVGQITGFYKGSYAEMKSKLTSKAAINALGNAKINVYSQGTTRFEGTDFAGNVVIQAEDDIFIVPTALYNAFVYSIKDYSHQYAELINELNNIKEQGQITFISLKGKISATGLAKGEGANIKMQAKGGAEVKNAQNIQAEAHYSTERGGLFGNSKQQISEETLSQSTAGGQLGAAESPLESFVINVGQGDIAINGVKIYAKKVSFIAPDGQVTFANSKKVSLYRYHKQGKTSFDFASGGFYISKSEEKFFERIVTEPEIALLVVNEEAYIACGKEYIQVGGLIKGEGTLKIISPKGYIFKSDEAKESTIYKHYRKGAGITLASSMGEVSIGAGYSKESEKAHTVHTIPVSPSVEVPTVVILGKGHLYTENLKLSAKDTIFDIGSHIDVPAFERYVEDREISAYSAAIKLGIRNNLAGAISSTSQFIEDASGRSGGSGVNAYFSGQRALIDWINSLDNPIDLGVWLEGGYSDGSFKVTSIIPHVSEIKSENVEIKANKIDYSGTQINAKKIRITAKEMLLKSAFGSFEVTDKQGNVHLNMPLISTGVSSFTPNVAGGLANSYKQANFSVNAKIMAGDEAIITISGPLQVEGGNIEANKLSLDVGSLLLKSVQNLAKSKETSWQVSANLANQLSEVLKGGGARFARSDSAWVNEVSSIIGKESLSVLVRESLKIVGGVIANAERNPDGSLTDKGKLTLKAAELYVENLYGYDNGSIIGGAVKLARNDADIDRGSVSANFGYHDNEQIIHASLGKGNVEIGGKPLEDDKVNRDLSKIKQEWGDKLKEVKVELVLLDGEKIARKFDNIKNTWSDPEGYIKGKVEGFSEELGKAKEKVQETLEDVKGAFSNKQEAVNDNKAEKFDEEEEIEIIDLDKLEPQKGNKPSNNNAKQEGKSYIVEPGDTLSEIAKKHGVSLNELKKANPELVNPDKIRPGDKIKLPTDARISNDPAKPTPSGPAKPLHNLDSYPRYNSVQPGVCTFNDPAGVGIELYTSPVIENFAFNPSEYEQNSMKLIFEWDGNRLKIVDNKDLDRLAPSYRQKAAGLMSNVINTVEATMEQLMKDIPVSTGTKNFVTKQFFIADLSMKYFADYYDAKEKGAVPSDAAIQSMANTWVNAILNVGGGGVIGTGLGASAAFLGATVLPFLGVPFVVGTVTVVGSVWGGNMVHEYMTKEGTIQGSFIQGVKDAMSDTIKNTYHTFKFEDNK